MTGRELWRNATSGDQFLDMPNPTAASFGGVAPQGYLAATADTLLVSCGRSVPAAFHLKTGALRHYEPATYRSDGGAWVTVADDLFFNQRHGPGPDRDIELGEAPEQPDDGMKAFRAGDGRQVFELDNKVRVVAVGNILYAAGGGSVEAFDLEALRQGRPAGEHRLWSVPHDRVYSVAVAGDAVLVGGRGAITALRRTDGARLWNATVSGQVRGLAVADSRLVTANEKGKVQVFESFTVQVSARRHREDRRWPAPTPWEGHSCPDRSRQECRPHNSAIDHRLAAELVRQQPAGYAQSR